MDSLRTVLVIIGLLIILGLLGHGLWTIRKNNQATKDKRESLERKRRRPPEDLFSAVDDGEPDAAVADPFAAKMQAKSARNSAHKKKPVHVEQADVAESGKTRAPHTAKQEPTLGDEPAVAEVEQIEINLEDDDFAPRQNASNQERTADSESVQPDLLDADLHDSDLLESDEPRVLSADESAIEAADTVIDEPMEEDLEATSTDTMQASVEDNSEDALEQATDTVPVTDKAPEIEVVTLFVTGDIQGAILLQMTTELGLKYGDMDIFHRHQESSGHGPVLFSVANMFNPGTFDIHSMERFETQGIVLFMTLPLKSDGHQAFTMMYNAANKIADAMPRAAVLDGNRNPVTKQSVQHTYQRIREFERKQRLHKTPPKW